MSKAVSTALLLLAGNASGQSLVDEATQPQSVLDELQRLRARVDTLETHGAGAGPLPDAAIDLSDEEVQSVQAARADHILARPWYANFDLRGYGAFTYLDSGGTGAVD